MDMIINKVTEQKENAIAQLLATTNWITLPKQMTLRIRVCKFILYETENITLYCKLVNVKFKREIFFSKFCGLLRRPDLVY